MLQEKAKKALRNIGFVLGFAVLGIIAVLAVIWADVPKNDNAKVLTMFFLFGFVAVVVVSVLGMLYVLVQNAAINRYGHIGHPRVPE